MATPLESKSTIDEIRQRFDHDVERFSNLNTGQIATIDAPLAMDLLRSVGFASVDVLHKNSCFAAFGGVKPAASANFAGRRDITG